VSKTLAILLTIALLGTACFLDSSGGNTASSAQSEKEDGGVSTVADSATSELARLLEAGNEALAAGDLRAATDYYEDAEELAPEDPFVKNNLGLVSMEKGYYSLAASHFREALDLLPYYYKAYNNLGNCYYHMEYYDLAGEAYEEALRIKPDYALAHWNYAMLLEKTGDELDAIRHWQRYISLAEGEGDAAFARDRIAALRDKAENGGDVGASAEDLEAGYDID
jgi:tetratricopeptide (TPR) repeat protein